MGEDTDIDIDPDPLHASWEQDDGKTVWRCSTPFGVYVWNQAGLHFWLPASKSKSGDPERTGIKKGVESLKEARVLAHEHRNKFLRKHKERR